MSTLEAKEILEEKDMIKTTKNNLSDKNGNNAT